MGIINYLAVSMLLLAGCYTRLANDHVEATESVSRCENCLAEVPFANSYQVCVWERNFFGYPEHRCYYTGYSSSWLYFHNTPWWYRNSYIWHDTRGCPPYYYHDRASRSCRYYGNLHARESVVAVPPRPELPRPELPPRPRPESRSESRSITSETPIMPLAPLYRDEEQRQVEQKPAEQKPIEQNDRPRPSMRGM